MKRGRLVAPFLTLALLGAACGLAPVDEPPDPSRREARAISYQVCRSAVERYGAERVARRLGAADESARSIARAFVREALGRIDGWDPYRRVGLTACAAGVRDATP